MAWDRALIYATGGVAFGGFNTNYSFKGNTHGNPLINGGSPFFGSNSFSNARVGLRVGGDIDYAVTNNWIVFAEYRYTDWGEGRNLGLVNGGLLTAPGLTGAHINSRGRTNQNQVQVGFSYNFD